MTAEPFDLIRVNIGRRHFHRRRQIQDDFAVRGRSPYFVHRVADLDCKVEFRAREAFGAVLEQPLRFGPARRVIEHATCGLHSDVDDARALQPEHDAPLHRRRRVVDMHDRAADAAQRLEGPFDQFGTRLRENLHRHVVGNQIAFDEFAHEIKVGLRCGRKTDLDFLEAGFHQQIEHAPFARTVHRLDERLIAVAQIDAAPHRGLHDHLVRPGAITQFDARIGEVFVCRFLEHLSDSCTGNYRRCASGGQSQSSGAGSR